LLFPVLLKREVFRFEPSGGFPILMGYNHVDNHQPRIGADGYIGNPGWRLLGDESWSNRQIED
jgi:hypothetical protein